MKKNLALIISCPLRYFFTLRYCSRVHFGKKVILNHKFIVRGPGTLIIGDDVNLWAHEEANRFMTFDKNAVIKIGARTRVNGATFQSKTAITVGEDCLIGSAILIDTDFHSANFDRRNNPAAIPSKPIHIKNKAWLAGQCAILKGVTVGEQSVVGFRAVVARDVPDHCIVAGNPAQVIKNLKIR